MRQSGMDKCDRLLDMWVIEEGDLVPGNKEFYESIFSLGNGYMGVRGFDEEDDRKTKHELCTFIAGIYDYFAAGKTDMVNTPNFWKTDIYINDEKFSLSKGHIVDYSKTLNMKEGILQRRVIWKDASGNETQIDTIRFLSLDSVHNAVLLLLITPLNYTGEIRIETGIDADVRNNIIDDDQMKNDVKLFDFLFEEGKNTIGDIKLIKLSTRESKYKICEGFATELLQNGRESAAEELTVIRDRYVGKTIKFDAVEGSRYLFCKYIGVWTSRDVDDESIESKVEETVKKAKKTGFHRMLHEHKAAWERKWDICDIIISGDDKCQRALRYNIFQLIQTNSEDDPRVSIGARGIMHGRYKGCVFWDTEIFMFPFYLYTNPKAAKNLLMYRYYTLPGAEENAKRQNLEGARYAWMSAIDGIEQCDTWDIGFSEVHITADVAYAINQYFEVTGDIGFICNYGLEILIKTARYWKSRFTYSEAEDKYNMLFVKGPNEYGGVTLNNLFTSMMATHNMELAIKHICLIKDKYPEKYESVVKKLEFDEAEMDIWNDIIKKAAVNYDAEKKLYIEDDNFFKLEPLDLKAVKEGDTPLYRKICFDRLQRYRVLKQADVLLLMFLIPYKFSNEEKLNAWYFYEPLTAHDSSLSYGTHSAMAARLGLMDEAYNYFVKSVCLDIDDVMGNTGIEGIHFASAGAVWQAAVNGFGGIEFDKDGLLVNPHLPQKWKRLCFKICYRGCTIKFDISHESLTVTLEEGVLEQLPIKVGENKVVLFRGKAEEVLLAAQEDTYAI